MKSRFFRAAVVCAALSALLVHRGDSLRALSSDLVISQVYGGGGNAGASYKNDFIEIFNRGTASVSLAGKSVQYASSTGSTWQVTALTDVTLAPGQYYLVQEAAGTGGTTSLPVPDATGSIPMSATAGKVALVEGTAALTGTCPTTGVIDFVGFGGANCFEGAATPALTNTTAALRRSAGCSETDSNAADFSTGAPLPRNTGTTWAPCGAGSTNPSGTLQASKTSLAPGEALTLTATVNAGTNPTSTGLAVTANLSAIGLGTATFFDDGVQGGDVVAGDKKFTFTGTIPANQPTSSQIVTATISDSQARTGATSPAVTISVQALTLADSTIVISQVYGGGGNGSATYRNDYVQLYNRGATTVDITGWSLQYASAAGTSWDNRLPLGGPIAPGEYYLIALGSNDPTVGAVVPDANVSFDLNISATTGKIALVGTYDILAGSCPASTHVKDFVGYGSNATCREGSANAPAPSSTTALFRDSGGFRDTNENSTDFLIRLPAPTRTAPIVELAPQVLNTDPRWNNATAPRDATIEVEFTEPVDVSGSWFDIMCATSGRHTDATFAGGGRSHYITPNVNFVAGETCTATIFKDQVTDQDLDDTATTNTLPATYVWSFKVATGTDAPFPSSVHLTMGNPSGAAPSVTEPNNYLMEKPEYALSYNRSRGGPNWVSWHLSDEWVGTLSRVDTFRADPAVPREWYRVQSFDFTGSGFDRGHMVPNADRDKETSIPINQATFLMSNMLPQAPNNNQGPWADFENYLRTLLPASATQAAGEVYVVAGGAGTGGIGSNGGVTLTLAGGRVAVPQYTWKVALVLPAAGGDDLSRVSCTTRTIALIMPNAQDLDSDWTDHLTTVDAVETLTGYDLFSNLPRQIQACVEAGTNGNNPPLDTTAPSVVCATPDTAWHNGNVALSCTASDDISGLASSGDASFSLVTSVADGEENGNAVTNSRVVCDVAGNCTTAGPIGGNKIDRNAPVISAISTTPDVLSPVNHKMIDVAVGYQVTKGMSGATCSLSVASNEAPNASGDGNTTVDWLILGPHHLQLRSERDGGGSGRTYTITITCGDSAGNATSATATVTVPK